MTDAAALFFGIGTSLIHRKRVPTTFGFAEVDPKGKAYKLPFTELNNG